MKFFVAIIAGAFVSLGLIAMMAALVASDDIYVEEVDDYTIIELTEPRKDSRPVHIKRVLEPPPEPVQKPSGISTVRAEPAKASTSIEQVEMPGIAVSSNFESQEFVMDLPQDTGATPIYRTLPRYPISAARQKIRGWVKLRFSINTEGFPEDIEVIESQPEEIFDQAAVDALARWKYRPKMESGQPVKQENLSVRIDFGKKN
ncbi:energy transducer TonB [Thalassotalea mangrovi]|uniref:Protein TonB n=1 Tax=Thalassotalea mangrovi TaxID=2572245 RepID=A0A4U1B2F9_9GAMM|nr:energy transducer TonB [Thalassotalea mangrovi]TKB43641.1 energy transducer TonB [Thalassotalea mangrovi]